MASRVADEVFLMFLLAEEEAANFRTQAALDCLKQSEKENSRYDAKPNVIL